MFDEEPTRSEALPADPVPCWLAERLPPACRADLVDLLTRPLPLPTNDTAPALAAALYSLAPVLAGAPLCALPAVVDRLRRAAFALLPGRQLPPLHQASAIKAALLVQSPEVAALCDAPWLLAVALAAGGDSFPLGLLPEGTGLESVDSLSAAAWDLCNAHQCLDGARAPALLPANWLTWPEAARVCAQGSEYASRGTLAYQRWHHRRLLEIDPSRSPAELLEALTALLAELEAERQQQAQADDDAGTADCELSSRRADGALRAVALVRCWGWPGDAERWRATFETAAGRAAWRDHRRRCWQMLADRLSHWQLAPVPGLTAAFFDNPKCSASPDRHRRAWQGHAVALLHAARTGAALQGQPLPDSSR